MAKVVSVEDMRLIEKSADAAGLSYDQMMVNAGRSIADAIQNHVDDLDGMHVLLLVGSGNNGGDALVVGRHLAEAGALVSVYLAKRRDTPDPHLDRLEEMGLGILCAQDDPDGEALSAALTGAVSGLWEIEDSDKGAGVLGFTKKDSLWQTRRRLAKDFWVDK